MSMMCEHMLSVANRFVPVRKTFLTVVVLLLVSGCAVMTPTGKEGPKPRDLTIHVTVKDGQGRPVKDAVVYAVQKERVPPTDRRKTVIVIANTAFQRVVQPVQVGSLITFQNRDRVQHHIYSISAAKKIDAPLKKGASSRPIRLNKAGVVVLGCAIHDPMFGYLYVVETAHFSVTGTEGTAELTGLPLRPIDIRIWHPSMETSSAAITKHAVPSSQGRASFDVVIPLKSRAGQELPSPASPSEQ